MNTTDSTALAPQDPDQTQRIAPYSNPAEAEFVLAQRQAMALSKSDLVPDAYKGKPANVMIALELAQRLGCSALSIMQSLFIVKGKPGFSGQFLIGLVNASPRFEPLQFEIIGSDARKKDYRIRAWAISKQTGERCNGAWIDYPMVEGEGWLKQNPKWVNMPELMFHYRAGSFFTRVFAPEISLGLLSREEFEDLHGQIGAIDGRVQRIDLAKQALLGNDPTPQLPEAGEPALNPTPPIGAASGQPPAMSLEEVSGNIAAATSLEKLDDARDLIRYAASSADRTALVKLADEKQTELEDRAARLLADASAGLGASE